MTDYLYDAALSFAGTEREYVREVAAELKRLGRRVFFDEDEQVSLWGENLIEKLDEVYRKQARFVVMFISEGYAASVWTRLERRSALTHALSERGAFVLPARLDDTELPGLLPSVHYLDIRGVGPIDLATRILAKITSTEPEVTSASDDRGWEYLLLADELERGVTSLRHLRSDQRVGFAPPTGERVASVDDVPQLVRTFTDEAQVWVESMARVMTVENQEAALGPPGQPGDAAAIQHFAAALTRVYEGLLKWTQRVRGIAVPTEATSVMWALSRLCERPIEQYEIFVGDFGARVRKAVHQLRADLPIDEPDIAVTLTLDIPPTVTAEYERAWSQFERQTLKRR